MKKHLLLVFVTGLLSVFGSSYLYAQQKSGSSDSATIAKRKAIRRELKTKYDSLTPEQQKRIREKISASAADMSPETKTNLRKAFRARYDSLSPEEKQKLKQAYIFHCKNIGICY